MSRQAIECARSGGGVVTYSTLPNWEPLAKDNDKAMRQIRWRMRRLNAMHTPEQSMMSSMEIGFTWMELFDEIKRRFPEYANCEVDRVIIGDIACPSRNGQCTRRCWRISEKP